MKNVKHKTPDYTKLEAFPFLLAHLEITHDFSDTDSHVGNLGYRAEPLGEEHFQHFINYMPVMTWKQKRKRRKERRLEGKQTRTRRKMKEEEKQGCLKERMVHVGKGEERIQSRSKWKGREEEEW